uniref:Uncharacterized mitochondrial protein AtMg00810-like n=1 Tax=Tanacetum cinerariifolium TaxID=118510 RepID=A0A6L2LBW1_TANCI|nr:uncharacterized mitochondrial protein AtMg00810-like [Tanacetum cinerariifolium]
MEKDSEIYTGKKERVKSIALKAKKESSDDETLTSGSGDEEYAMAVRNFKKFFRKKDAVIQIISLAIVQNHLATKIKRPSLEVLGSIAKMTPKTKLTMKLVSWLNRRMSKKSKSHLIIVQIYVDDIIFGSTSQNLCDDFAKIMHDKFEMSMMGELNFFLGLQIKQMEDEIFFNQSKYVKKMLRKFWLEDSKPTKTPMSTEIKLTNDDEVDFVDNSKYRGTKIPSEYQQDYKKIRAYSLKIYNDLIMSDTLRDIYKTLESRYVHEGRTIDPSIYSDLNDDSVAKFTAIGFDCLLSLDEQIFPRMMYFFRDRRDKVLPYVMFLTRLFKKLKANIAQWSFDERHKLVPRKMSSLKAKQPKKPPPKRTRNVGKFKRT